MVIVREPSISTVLEQIVFAPFNHPGILPSVLPLVLGAFIIELYFGKYKQESLGWNSSVGNSVLWIATGVNLLVSGAIKSGLERYVSYFLVLAGVLVGYMNFYHKWSPSIGFRAASADVVYPLAYVAVVVVKTGIEIGPAVLKASMIFIVSSLAFFRAIRALETPARQFRLR